MSTSADAAARMSDQSKEFPPFSAEELLYHRFNENMIGAPRGAAPFVLLIRVPDASVNRRLPDGAPDDVVQFEYPKYADWGIIMFRVGDVPSVHERAEGKPIYYTVQHAPEPSNCYHSEIRAFGDATYTTRLSNLKHTAKTWFRLSLSARLQATNILRKPKTPSDSPPKAS